MTDLLEHVKEIHLAPEPDLGLPWDANKGAEGYEFNTESQRWESINKKEEKLPM